MYIYIHILYIIIIFSVFLNICFLIYSNVYLYIYNKDISTIYYKHRPVGFFSLATFNLGFALEKHHSWRMVKGHGEGL